MPAAPCCQVTPAGHAHSFDGAADSLSRLGSRDTVTAALWPARVLVQSHHTWDSAPVTRRVKWKDGPDPHALLCVFLN